MAHETFPRFFYNSYWGKWSRRWIIQDENHYDIIELNLTPIPSCYSSTWDNDVRCEKFRCHGTATSEGDKAVEYLPDYVKEEMYYHLGMKLTAKLLTHDYWKEITPDDVRKARKASNGGGVPLQFIKDFRDGKATFHTN